MFDNLKTMVAAARSGVSFSTFASAKRGMSLGELPQAVIVFGIAAITLSVMATVVAGVKATQTADSTEANISTQALSGLTKIGDFLPTIGLVVAAVLVIGLIMRSFSREAGY